MQSFAYSLAREVERDWVQALKEDDPIDVLKFTHLSGKAIWSRGKVITIKPSKLKIQF